MTFAKQIRNLFAHLFHDPPGERFVRHHQRWRQNGNEHPLRKATLLIIGIIVVVAGIAMLVLPGPGILSILAGLLLIAARAPRFAQWLDRSEVAVRNRFHQRLRR